MEVDKINDLADFMNSVTTEIANEYIRIQKRVKEDPGTAGDQGEENWATVLRDWLSPTFQIVTKGRILSHHGIASPQVDVLVLLPEYPKYLLDKKLYLAGGVLAAFECKITLTAKHIEDFVSNSVNIKNHFQQRRGTPYKELHTPIIYGLLAHSHSWKKENSTPIENIELKLYDTDIRLITHPIQMPDIICVADLATWRSSKLVFHGPLQAGWSKTAENFFGLHGSAKVQYIRHNKSNNPKIHFTPLGAMITILFKKIAMEFPNLRPLSEFFDRANIRGDMIGRSRNWPSTIYSEQIRERVEKGDFESVDSWNEWKSNFD